MREKNILFALLALNLALLFAFSSYLVLSGHEKADEEPGGRRAKPDPTPPPATAPAPRPDPYATEMAAADRVFTFRDVESSNYLAYLGTLKKAGCPPQHLRHIVLSDVNELFAQRRIEEAIRHDFEWWRADPQPVVARLLREKGEELADRQQHLAQKLLGAPIPRCLQYWTHVPLTGAVLGALSEKLHAEVQEICRQTMTSGTADPAASNNPVAAARIRAQMRAELIRLLTAEQLEEFVIRYSHESMALRKELGTIGPTAD